MTTQTIRRAVLIVALLNLAYFFVEFVASLAIGSASLAADSADFLEDTAINLLVFVAVAWPAQRRRVAGSVLAALILIPAIAAIVMVVTKLINPVAPSPEGLTGVAVGALVVNVICAVILLRLRDQGSSLAKGAWLAARNDALANLLIIVAGLLTFVWSTAWFDIVVGAIIAVINLSAAKEVWEESREEHASVEEAFADMEDC
ncbi:cation transporter [Corynebacterium godavarianum]|uniref:Cation transporter n=1 Tax=Corynebacterium godavarianum TaxID=2054421 RepID=A0ABY3E7A0_9CORY|nr:cation transporter [Corynebacterium godavarianum]MBL7285472.1 cation transporter [Corynebacterium godavarianum]TSJ75664.1 cation transporter [Corynebacterium godavarianum]